MLGGIGKEKGKCYFIIGNNVLIGVGVKVLGLFKVGDNIKIGVNVVVFWEVEENLIVVGVLGRVVRKEKKEKLIVEE